MPLPEVFLKSLFSHSLEPLPLLFGLVSPALHQMTAPEALPADNPEVGEYDFVFTPGVLNNTNYVLNEENPYRVWTK